jgi:hypothetical protein
MAKAKRGKAGTRAEARRLADMVEEAIEDGAGTAEEIHKAIANMPLAVLEELDLFADVVKDVRKVQETSIGAIYDAIRKVNREAAQLADDLLARRPGRPGAATRPKRAKSAKAA